MSNHPTFAVCPKKVDARKTTIIEPYRQHFGDALSVDKQYWTMCASQVDDGGKFSTDSELGQMLGSGLITKDQFYGVDIKSDVIDANKTAMPDCNWITGDFGKSMRRAYKAGNFNPGIVNADFVVMSAKASYIIADIISFLTYIEASDVLLVANIMANNPYGSGKIPEDFVPNFEDISNSYLSNSEFSRNFKAGGWTIHPELFYYWGTGERSKTVMCTYCFIKR